VKYVSHDWNDEFQFLCGGDEHTDVSVCVYIHASHILERGPDQLRDFTYLRKGFSATHVSEETWELSAISPDEADSETERVYVILDPEYGQNIAALAVGAKVWLVDSPANRTAWNEREPCSLNSAIFKTSDSNARAENLLAELPNIEDHFGPYSSSIPYRVLEVIGLSLAADMESALRAHGFDGFVTTTDGFEALIGRP
jgi:hypothetical protein